ncbi:MAG: amidohydrolase family protein [Bacteroidia bacterium]|nr:amidohydrolase family protein [Bacteroidia bacterium]
MPIFTADLIFTPQGFEPHCLLHLDETGKVLRLERSVKEVPAEAIALEGVLAPGFVNAHCHLELSHLAGMIPRGTGLAAFAQKLMAARFTVEEGERRAAMVRAEQEMKAAGIVAVGDISNLAESFGLKEEGNLRYHTFVELIGLLPERADMVLEKGQVLLAEVPVGNGNSAGFAPHAPYSVSPKLFSAIMEYEGKHSRLSSIHNQESLAEDEFFKQGTGPLRGLYDHLGIDLSGWMPPGKASLEVFYPLVKDGVRMIFVHNTFTEPAQARATMALHPDPWYCLCVKANLYIEQALPDVPGLLDAGVRFCLGTDSLASNDQLSILDEMRTLQRCFPRLATAEILTWATLHGAMALGFSQDLGSFLPGKRPGLNLLTGLEGEELRLGEKSAVRALL